SSSTEGRTMTAVSSGGLAELHEAAASPLARPSAAQLLPLAQSAEGIPRLERLLLTAARRAPRELAGAAADLVRAGGKRVRPLLVLLSARAAMPGRRARGRVPLALVAEMVHSATLLHDDVIDDGLTRRGLPAPRVAYGNGVSVIAGDWLLAASLELALRADSPGALEALVRTLRQLVEGEARQIALRGKTDFTSDDALQIAHLKTGSLFAFCGEAGALAARAPVAVVAALRSPRWSASPTARPGSSSPRSPGPFSREVTDADDARPDIVPGRRDGAQGAGAPLAARSGGRGRRTDGVLGLQAGDGTGVGPALPARRRALRLRPVRAALHFLGGGLDGALGAGALGGDPQDPQGGRPARVLRGGDRHLEDDLAGAARARAGADRARAGGLRARPREAAVAGGAGRAFTPRGHRGAAGKAGRPRARGAGAAGRHCATRARRSRPADAVSAAAALELDRYPEPPGVVAEDQPAASVEVVQMRPAVLGEQGRPLDPRIEIRLARQIEIQGVQVHRHSESGRVAVAPTRAMPALRRLRDVAPAVVRDPERPPQPA